MSKIALIAASIADVRTWRESACVTEADSPWVKFFGHVDLHAPFFSVICLPGWDRRPLNPVILQRVQAALTAPSPLEIETERSQAELEIRTDMMNRAIANGVSPSEAARAALDRRLDDDSFIERDLPVNLFDSGIGDTRGTRDAETAFPSVPLPPANSDEAYCMSHPLMTPALFGRMGETARAHFADLMRNNNRTRANIFIREASAMFGVSLSSRTPPRPSILPFADNFRDVARQERIEAGRRRAEEARRNTRFGDED